jgi:HlyD family secretion protein
MSQSRQRLLLAIAALLLVAGAGYAVWRYARAGDLPSGFAVGNGRIEAERIDIATKFSGRLREVLANESDWVAQGAVLARLDADDIRAELRVAQAEVNQARQRLAQAAAAVAERESQLKLAEIELQRALFLLQKGNVSKQVVDQRTAQRDLQTAGLASDQATVGNAAAAIEAAIAHAERLQVDLEEYSLTAPRAGRVQYRMALPGEMLPAGGRVLTLLDLTDVYMEIFLPTDQVGRLPIGAEARIVLDAAPEYVIPASVTFVAADAQFTPRQVETARERENLMFRVKVQIASDLLERYMQLVKTGLPGVAYVRIDPAAAWPERLTPRLPDAK